MLCLLLPLGVQAQITGGVFSPVVNEGHRSAQFRTAHNVDTSSFAQRLHYQQAINDSQQWRVVGQWKRPQRSDTTFDFVQFEYLWQQTPNGQAHQSGWRFDARLPRGDRPEQLGVNWINDFTLSEALSLRAILLLSGQFGAGHQAGITVQSRGQLHYKANAQLGAGVAIYSGYGTTADFADLDQQSHHLGPYVNIGLAQGYSLHLDLLTDVNSNSSDTTARLWLGKSF